MWYQEHLHLGVEEKSPEFQEARDLRSNPFQGGGKAYSCKQWFIFIPLFFTFINFCHCLINLKLVKLLIFLCPSTSSQCMLVVVT